MRKGTIRFLTNLDSTKLFRFGTPLTTTATITTKTTTLMGCDTNEINLVDIKVLDQAGLR